MFGVRRRVLEVPWTGNMKGNERKRGFELAEYLSRSELKKGGEESTFKDTILNV